MSNEHSRTMLVCPVGNGFGGAEQVMLAIGRQLQSLGRNPVFVVMRPGRLVDIARQQGLESYAFHEDHRYREIHKVLRASRWLGKLCKTTGCTLMHSTHTAHLYAALASREIGIPEVWHLHDVPSRQDAIGWLSMKLKPRHVIFTTRDVCDGYPELRGGSHCVIPPTCVEPDKLRAIAGTAAIRKKFAIPPGPLVLTVARMQEHKGHLDLLDAAATALRLRPDLVFVLAGSASTQEQLQYLARLRERGRQLNISARLIFTGEIDDEDLVALYRAATLMLHPAWSEGYGLVLLEAMSLGLPVIAAAATGPAEIIQDDEDGLLVPPRDPAYMAESILRLLSDEALRRKLIAQGRQKAERLSLPHMIKQVLEIYDSL